MSFEMMQEPRSLASLEPGDEAVIDTIYFGSLRSLCGDIGIHEGDAVRCRGGTAGVLLLVTAEGRTVSLARDWARYIRVTAPAQPLSMAV